MPYAPKRPCREPMCRNFCEGKNCYCSEHKRKHDREYNRFTRDKELQAFYESTEWKKKRAEKLGVSPLCEECLKIGRVRPAQVVDHIVPIRRGGEKLDIDNLQSLCNGCHATKSAKEGSTLRRYDYS